MSMSRSHGYQIELSATPCPLLHDIDTMSVVYLHLRLCSPCELRSTWYEFNWQIYELQDFTTPEKFAIILAPWFATRTTQNSETVSK